MNYTILFISIVIISITVFDFWIIAKKGKSESVSAHIIRAFKKYPMLPLISGVIIGHLVWSMDTFDWAKQDELKERCRAILYEKQEITKPKR